MSEHADSQARIPIGRYPARETEDSHDYVAVEEPMEIRVGFGPRGSRSARSLSITMRTPGDDFELAAGFLFTEGLVDRREQIERVEFCGPAPPGRSTSNIVRVELADDVTIDPEKLQRNFYTTSSCGICGKASLDALHVLGIAQLEPRRPLVGQALIRRLPGLLRTGQAVFDRTGGLHAAALFDAQGERIAVREDVGRHNAVDKLIGRRFLDGGTPLADEVLVVSGRASFEILQKALVAGVPMLVAVGAPSSLAVQMAQRFGMSLVGFASGDRFNVYSGADRIMMA